MMKANDTPVLSFQNIGKAFGENWVLSDVSIDIMQGEIHAICGENGAGKSTLMNILFGMPVIQETGGYTGKILIDGTECKMTSPDQAIANGIGMVHQEFMLIPGFSVGENIKLNREPLSPSPAGRLLGKSLDMVNFGQISSESQETLDRLGVTMQESSMIDTLPVGYMQFAEIAREIDKKNIKVLILDEPTAALTESEAQIVLRIVKRLSELGIAVILITHRIEDIMQVGDTVTVLRDGRNVKTVSVKGITEGEIAQLMVGRDLDLSGIRGNEKEQDPEIAVRIRNLCVDMPGELVNGVDLDIHRGEIFGIGGLAGQGKVGIANGLMGLFPTRGEITVNGRPLPLNAPQESIRAGLAFVSEDRRKMGFAPDLTIAENITGPSILNHNRFLKRCGFFTQVDTKAIREKANEYIEEFQIRCTGPDQPVGTLSGGNQQKVCVAGALMLEPDILLVSEPTRGIDVGAKSMVLSTISRISRERGCTVIFTSSELGELRQICGRIAIIANGKVSGILKPDDSDEAFGLAMSGKGMQQ